MVKKTILSVLMCFVMLNIQAQFENQRKETTFFAQGLFKIESKSELETIQSQIKEIPIVSLVRLDWSTQRFFILTKNTDHLSHEDVEKWFGDLYDSLRCIQIGVKGIDEIHNYPFTNCQD